MSSSGAGRRSLSRRLKQCTVRVPRYWLTWRRLRPLPPGLSYAAVVEAARRRPVTGFNGEVMKAYVVASLFRHFECTAFVETGTSRGDTTGYVSRTLDAPVHSCEVDPLSFAASRLNLLWARRVHLYRLSSPDFLRRVLAPAVVGANPFFYLDAHWYDYMPLPDELALIAERAPRGVIAIDDFYVPGRDGFAWDESGGIRIDRGVVDRCFRARVPGAQLYVSAYDPSLEPGGPRHGPHGMAVVLFGQRVPMPAGFPFDLLAEAP